MHFGPVFLADGNRFLYTVSTLDPALNRQVFLLRAGSLDSPEIIEVGEVGSQVALLDSGYLVHVGGGTLTARRFDSTALRFTGRPIPIADGVYQEARGDAKFSAARSGTILYRKRAINQSVVWFGAGGERLEALEESGVFDWLDISPDGAQAALEVRDQRIGTADVWLYGLDRSTRRRLTDQLKWEGRPVWTPDGGAIVFSAAWERLPDVYIQDVDAGEAENLLATESLELVTDVSPDGRRVLYSVPGPAGDFDLWVMPIDDSASAAALVAAPGHQIVGKFSPDGGLVAYPSNETGRFEIWVRPFPEAGRSLQISTEGGWMPAWASGEPTLFYARERGIYAVDLSTPAKRARPQPQLRFETPHAIQMFDVAPDGRFLVVLRDDSIVEPNHVIVNWRPPED